LIHIILLFGGLWILLNASAIAQGQQHVSGPQVTPSAPKAPDQSEQTNAPPQPETQPQDKPQDKKKEKRPRRGAFVVAPIPISSPAIGSGIVPVLGYIFPFSTKDKVSPPSVVGVAGLFTNDGSRGFAVGGQLYLKENRYRITSGFAHGNINYDIYGNGIAAGLKLPLKQTGEAFLVEFLRRIGWKFFIGPRFVTGRSFLTVRPNRATNFPIPPEAGIHSNLTAIGAQLTRDTSLNRFYPTGGTFFTFTSDFFSDALGSKYSFQSYKTTFSKYRSLSGKQVLAYNAFFCATGGSPPFYANCVYGTSNQLRGYTAGRYFTRYMLATQLEYRLELPKRFGLVGFGGVGGVIPGGSQLLQRLQSSHFLPSGGVGLRFQLDKKNHVNLRADFAQGRDGHTFGLAVGEAF
jgi:outer membrane protein assembly factor BamA